MPDNLIHSFLVWFPFIMLVLLVPFVLFILFTLSINKGLRKGRFKYLLIVCVLFIGVMIIVFSSLSPKPLPSKQYTYKFFIEKVKMGEVKHVTFQDRIIQGLTSSNERFTVNLPKNVPHLLPLLIKSGVGITAIPPNQ